MYNSWNICLIQKQQLIIDNFANQKFSYYYLSKNINLKKYLKIFKLNLYIIF